ncbi:MAG: SGNH/GDSL hydrolase family protein [Victivallales bacterium]|nr:SGNH/GDSL hydrolase family protein [Victivallales bacterium]
MKKLLLLFALLCGVMLLAETPVCFAPGERVVFFGDSITHGGGYIFHIQMFEDLRYPGSGMVMLNAGISGDTAAGGCKRWGYEVLPMNPDRVFVMFGMNDVGISFYKTAEPTEEEQKKRQNNLTNYANNQKRLAEMILKEGKKLVLMTPTAYDQYGEVKADNKVAANEPGLANCAEIVRQLAAEKNLGLVELHKPYTEQLKAHPELHLCGQDRVHPQGAGHLLVAALILEAAGEDGMVAEVDIDVTSKEPAIMNRIDIVSRNARTSDATVPESTAKGFSFKYAPNALPFPVTPDYKTVEMLYPITEKLNREIIRVKGLPQGSYVLKADGVEIATATAEELAKGVNIAILATPSQKKAREAAVVKQKLHNAARLVRSVPYMNTVILNRKGNLDNMEECFQVLDKWLEEKANTSNYTYFQYQVKTYKELRPVMAEKQQEIEALRKQLAAFRPEPFVIAVEAK